MMTFIDTIVQDADWPTPVRTAEALLDDTPAPANRIRRKLSEDPRHYGNTATALLAPVGIVRAKSAPLTPRERLIRAAILTALIVGGLAVGMLAAAWAGGLLR